MSTTVEYHSDVDVLSEILLSDTTELTPAAARWALNLRLSTSQEFRLAELLALGNKGGLTKSERAELERFMRVGGWLSLLHARALATLAEADKEMRDAT